jgi:hypothetical protein
MYTDLTPLQVTGYTIQPSATSMVFRELIRQERQPRQTSYTGVFKLSDNHIHRKIDLRY